MTGEVIRTGVGDTVVYLRLTVYSRKVYSTSAAEALVSRLAGGLNHSSAESLGESYWQKKQLQLQRIDAEIALLEFEKRLNGSSRSPQDSLGTIFFDSTFSEEIQAANSLAKAIEQDAATLLQLTRHDRDVAERPYAYRYVLSTVHPPCGCKERPFANNKRI